MTRPELAARRVRTAYERAHVIAATRSLAITALVILLAIGLHRTSSAMWLIAGMLAVTLAVFGWRGGSWRRGAIAGVIAGLPPMIVPSVVFTLSYEGHCASCATGPSTLCLVACFGTSSLVGMLVGRRAMCDAAPSRFALAAIASATFTGLLGCGTTGLGGALGVVIGLVAGGVTGWVIANRTAQV